MTKTPDKNTGRKSDNYGRIRSLTGAVISFLLTPFAFAGLLEEGAGFLSNIGSFGLGVFCLGCGVFLLYSYIKHR